MRVKYKYDDACDKKTSRTLNQFGKIFFPNCINRGASYSQYVPSQQCAISKLLMDIKADDLFGLNKGLQMMDYLEEPKADTEAIKNVWRIFSRSMDVI